MSYLASTSHACEPHHRVASIAMRRLSLVTRCEGISSLIFVVSNSRIFDVPFPSSG